MKKFCKHLPLLKTLVTDAVSVDRTMWKKCCFSGDGEYVCAGSARQHALYIWEKSIGNLVKILHGTKGELLLDVVVSYLLYLCGSQSFSFHSMLKFDCPYS